MIGPALCFGVPIVVTLTVLAATTLLGCYRRFVAPPPVVDPPPAGPYRTAAIVPPGAPRSFDHVENPVVARMLREMGIGAVAAEALAAARRGRDARAAGSPTVHVPRPVRRYD